ncbi:MAG: hypothetical protein ACI93T_002056, partial [Porticoccaceae bacterium]
MHVKQKVILTVGAKGFSIASMLVVGQLGVEWFG